MTCFNNHEPTSEKPRIESDIEQQTQKRIKEIFGRTLTEEEITEKYAPEVFEITMVVLEEISRNLEHASQQLLKIAQKNARQGSDPPYLFK
jgi:hypothetical protein